MNDKDGVMERPSLAHLNSMPLTRHIGAVLRERRERARLTQAMLARRTGVSRATIHLLETGQRGPRLETLERLCAGLDCIVMEVIAEADRRSRRVA